MPGALPPGMHVAGAANGALTLGRCLSDGVAAGAMAAVECGFRSPRSRCRAPTTSRPRVTPLWHVKDSRAKAFVDFQNDVTTKDIALADQEGFRSVEHLKRYTTLGMATDQGKVVERHRALRSSPKRRGRTIPRSAPRPIGRLMCR